jgi:hypothetical protein
METLSGRCRWRLKGTVTSRGKAKWWFPLVDCAARMALEGRTDPSSSLASRWLGRRRQGRVRQAALRMPGYEARPRADGLRSLPMGTGLAETAMETFH